MPSIPSHAAYSHLTFVLLTFSYPSIQNTRLLQSGQLKWTALFPPSKISCSKRMAGRRAGLAAQTAWTGRWWAAAAVIEEKCRKESADGTRWSAGYFQCCSHTPLTHGKHKKGTSLSDFGVCFCFWKGVNAVLNIMEINKEFEHLWVSHSKGPEDISLILSSESRQVFLAAYAG